MSSPSVGKRRYESDARRARGRGTRAALVAAARTLFGAAGFFATGIPEMVAAARVTRGALYHHFSDKEALFAEVFRVVADDLRREAETRVASLTGDTWAQFVGGLTSYLTILSMSGEAQRILMIDGPAVLGWERWREAQDGSIFAGTLATLEMLVDEGMVVELHLDSLAHLIHAALNEAALVVAHAVDHQEANRRMTDGLKAMLSGIRSETGMSR